MTNSLSELNRQAEEDISSCLSLKELDSVRVFYLGKKGKVSLELKSLSKLNPKDRPEFGKKINEVKKTLQKLIAVKKAELNDKKIKASIDRAAIDVTLPGKTKPIGQIHPLSITLNAIEKIFINAGFIVDDGPEIEDEYHNFTALNLPEHHPARDMQDTFFIDSDIVLRTHTSNVQIHLMENQDPPLRHICCGRVFRNEAVSYKSFCLFHQVEGLVINESSSFAEMKGTLEYFAKEMFGKDTKMRFRPSYFPFTEPSAEVDIWNDKLNQWMEILGCGMVNPNVLENVGYDSEKYQGFAFGMGIERIAMIKYGIRDIRLFYQNDKRFLEQF